MGIIIECENISKSYGKKKALSDVSFKIESGKIVGLLGLNGCGKSTLIRILTGICVTGQGSMSIMDGSVKLGDKDYYEKLRSMISYCPDKLEYKKERSVRNIIEDYEAFFDDFDRDNALKALDNEKIDVNEKIGALSKGQAEKVKVIMTMSRSARLYVLDEPLDGIDVVSRDSIIKMMIERVPEDASMLISSHNIADIENVLDETIFLKNGQVILQKQVDELRDEKGKSLVDVFKEYNK